MGKLKPPYFRARISTVGTDRFSAGYQTIYDKNALSLLKKMTCTMANDLGGKEMFFPLLLQTCVKILDEILKDESKNKTINDFMKDVDMTAWDIE